ncbi:MAG: tripartite tricarboxylate transporter TctB family protein [Pseudomonadota bacterium]
MNKQDAAIAAGIAALAAAGYWHTGSFPRESATWPAAVLVIIAILSVALIIVAIARPAPATTLDSDDKAAASRRTLVRLGGVVVLMIAYVALVPIVGFYVTTALLLTLYLTAWGGVKPMKTGAYTLASLTLIYLLTTMLLAIPLPRGILV